MSVNDKIYKGLYNSEGTTINEKIYNYLGSLGYTGSFNDRLSKLEANGKKGWQALLSETPALEVVGSLFSEGQQGVMYIPKPTYLGQQALYQDAAGTTPVSADGDPVGLMLDVSQGLERGPDIVANGGFDDGSEWSLGLNWSIEGGVATRTENGGSLTQSGVSFVGGRSYEVIFDLISIDAGTVTPRFAGSTVSDGVSVSSPGSVRQIIQANDTNTAFQILASSSFSGSVDNISVRELPGNHASQSTSASRPLYRTDGTLHWLEFDGVDDRLNATVDMSAAGKMVLSASFDRKSTGSRQYVLSHGGESPQSAALRISTGGNEFIAQTQNEGSGSEDLLLVKAPNSSYPAKGVITGRHYAEGSLTELRLNGSSVGVNTDDHQFTAFRNTSLEIGGDGGGTGFIDSDVFGAVAVGADVPGGAMDTLESYLAKLAGITL